MGLQLAALALSAYGAYQGSKDKKIKNENDLDPEVKAHLYGQVFPASAALYGAHSALLKMNFNII